MSSKNTDGNNFLTLTSNKSLVNYSSFITENYNIKTDRVKIIVPQNNCKSTKC